MRVRLRSLLGAVLALGLCACSGAPSSSVTTSRAAQPSGSGELPTSASSGTGSATTGASGAGATASATQALDQACLSAAGKMDVDSQVALLYMGAVTTTSPSQASAQLAAQRTGSVLLMADPGSAAATTQLTAALHDADPQLLVAVDQEGGQVQRLSGTGFAGIPAASDQAQQPTATLTTEWNSWGAQLRQAGVLYNLAPVSDLVPAQNRAANAPIGQLGRGYGSTRADVVANASAVIGGLHAAGLVASTKHFPGLGNVSVNTDFGVAHDTVTTADSQEVAVFADLVDRTDSVMVGSVVYDRIDPDHPALFSPTIVQGLLRERLGFAKVIVSDDLGAAAALAGYPLAGRGTTFLRAGGDLALDVDPASVPAMMADTIRAAGADPEFAGQLATKAARVLALKQSAGLLRCGA
ncbi:MAG: glycoside hydrolase family 3 N-terminal domain-containing protein [Propionibacterium sp.]